MTVRGVRWRHDVRVRVVAAAGVIACDEVGRILLVRRVRDECWGVPGGHLEGGETWQQCAEREFAEETGRLVAISGLLGIYSDPATQVADSTTWREEVQFVGVVFEGRVLEPLSSVVVDRSEISGAAFFELGALPSRLYPPDGPVLEDVASARARPFVK